MASFNYESRKKRDIIKLMKDAGKASFENIHVHVDDNYMNLIKILIIGPENTPYQGGYYFLNYNYYPYILLNLLVVNF